jgi:hypothetical protein
VLKKTLDPGIKEQLTQYGELVQATYDNLGLNPCDHAQYGNALETPDKLLAYTQGNYRVAQGHEGPKQSTYARCASKPAVSEGVALALRFESVGHALAAVAQHLRGRFDIEV